MWERQDARRIREVVRQKKKRIIYRTHHTLFQSRYLSYFSNQLLYVHVHVLFCGFVVTKEIIIIWIHTKAMFSSIPPCQLPISVITPKIPIQVLHIGWINYVKDKHFFFASNMFPKTHCPSSFPLRSTPQSRFFSTFLFLSLFPFACCFTWISIPFCLL